MTNENGSGAAGGTTWPSAHISAAPALLEVRAAVPDTETGLALAHSLVAQQLAACVQVIGPITSVYSWQGEAQQGDEWLLLMKTTEDAFEAVSAVILAEHPYEVPEILGVRVTHALPAYAEWVRKHSDGISDAQLLHPHE
ncbi:divalent-cation tolerance protein CutA [Ornithinimicrobium pratense]|uniref:Divalent-cation tolerance protein CutA n=1 Tax=Ornithinimicrobium pratense TaxID=2593973 RepID=A0A5J6V7W7_9MICO|nr:divalent-cation tolerance protein CutA [Ornithinimicrobium pratense]QFG69657.1 divalent-cation tolerance protein CutA [Ornithinimicrobium pratense]